MCGSGGQCGPILPEWSVSITLKMPATFPSLTSQPKLLNSRATSSLFSLPSPTRFGGGGA